MSAKLILAVVDDDLTVRRALMRMLRACGHDVRVFASAEDYLAEDCHPDCAILDVQLPGLSGIELEGQLRRTGRTLPVIFITAHDDQVTRESVTQTRRRWLRKPFDEEGLLEAIAEATTPNT